MITLCSGLVGWCHGGLPGASDNGSPSGDRDSRGATTANRDGVASDLNREQKQRARELGIEVGILPAGEFNAITDVEGVLVGHQTISRGDSIRTGVTVILPHGDNLFRDKVPAAIHVGNGFGKLAGSTQVNELGNLETPIALTNTLSVPIGVQALVNYTLRQPGNGGVQSVNAVVGETNDGYLNDIRGMHVTQEDVWAALEAAAAGEVEEGSVGAGTGTRCFDWKGGIGTSSRRLPDSLGGYTVGVLVQSNFGGILTLQGAPVGRELGRFSYRELTEVPADEGGSCMIVVATDAPLSHRNLQRLAERALFGLARSGSVMSNGSGDYVIAFSTGFRVRTDQDSEGETAGVRSLPNDRMNPLFLGVVEATEEAIYNSLLMATTTQGRSGRVVRELPVDATLEILRRYQMLDLQQRLPSVRE